ncbi:hypothetical protein HRUBRA_02584 [Pseudohaliea rubra DSM 19751]|uniref:Uncharacterized protein n=1 Tax=Pseudohaliea rubra DSM 19751 TaxID=1265313 RepID=A0A095VN05_9GAMM|nr:hypothetical protein HRUBRA_02584 [Pseudohaliea rubra DSM 19751]
MRAPAHPPRQPGEAYTAGADTPVTGDRDLLAPRDAFPAITTPEELGAALGLR